MPVFDITLSPADFTDSENDPRKLRIILVYFVVRKIDRRFLKYIAYLLHPEYNHIKRVMKSRMETFPLEMSCHSDATSEYQTVNCNLAINKLKLMSAVVSAHTASKLKKRKKKKKTRFRYIFGENSHAPY